MNGIKLALTATLAFTSVACFAGPKTLEAWEKCRDKAEASVDQREVGIAGVEAEIKNQCGGRPVKELGTATGAIGVLPSDVVRSKAWKKKFMGITKGKYKVFSERLSVASETKLEGEWITGEGIAPHSGGSDEAAFAINTKSGQVFGAMLEEGNQIHGFGFGESWDNAPSFLREWAAARR
jgi:hypothetical protein